MNENWPQAYKDGFQDFYGRDFVVSPHVLIPRPETEMAVDAVLNLAGAQYLPGVKPATARISRGAKILDVGTGSGVIAVTLALELPEAEVSAVDLSENALAVARENAAKLGAEVKFWRSDLLDNVDGDFDVIVANLPYVDVKWGWLDKEALAAEPSLALYAPNDGLALIFKLIDQIAEKKCTKYVVLEADLCQHRRIRKYARSKNFEHIETRGLQLLFLVGGEGEI